MSHPGAETAVPESPPQAEVAPPPTPTLTPEQVEFQAWMAVTLTGPLTLTPE